MGYNEGNQNNVLKPPFRTGILATSAARVRYNADLRAHAHTLKYACSSRVYEVPFTYQNIIR